MTSTADDAHIDTLPSELLKSVWRHLSFFDLIRCQQVCRSWRASLPGNDPALRRALFSGTPTADGVDANEIELTIDLEERPSSYRKESPYLVLSLSVWNAREYPGRFEEDNIDVDYHPIVENLHDYSSLVHPMFNRGRLGKRTLAFSFSKAKGLKKLARPVESNGASWERMQVSKPPLKRWKLSLEWHLEYKEDKHECHSSRGFERWNETGVTVGQFVEAIRATLANATESVQKFGYMYDPDEDMRYHFYDSDVRLAAVL